MSGAGLDRGRLARVLDRCASPFDGEALVAARLADRLVRAAGTTWTELLAVPVGGEDWPADLDLCLSRMTELTNWEISFVDNIGRRVFPPTPGQQKKLAEIARRLRGRPARAA